MMRRIEDFSMDDVHCSSCGGQGGVGHEPCTDCYGTGYDQGACHELLGLMPQVHMEGHGSKVMLVDTRKGWTLVVAASPPRNGRPWGWNDTYAITTGWFPTDMATDTTMELVSHGFEVMERKNSELLWTAAMSLPGGLMRLVPVKEDRTQPFVLSWLMGLEPPARELQVTDEEDHDTLPAVAIGP